MQCRILGYWFEHFVAPPSHHTQEPYQNSLSGPESGLVSAPSQPFSIEPADVKHDAHDSSSDIEGIPLSTISDVTPTLLKLDASDTRAKAMLSPGGYCYDEFTDFIDFRSEDPPSVASLLSNSLGSLFVLS